MVPFMYALAALVGALGLMVLLAAQSAVHEILAAVAFVVAAVLLGSAAVVAAVNKLRQAVQARQTGADEAARRP